MLGRINQYMLRQMSSSFVKVKKSSMSTMNNVNVMKNKIEPENKKRPLDDNAIVESDAKIQKTERIKKRNFCLMLGYLGKDYFGMQRNPPMKTIEEDLINALFKAQLIDGVAFETIQHINYQRAARTDKGVSATRQICSLKLPEHANIDVINEFLPKEIRVFGLKRVTKGFNSKNQCNARSYTYTLPTFAFAPDDPSILNREYTDEEIDARIKQLETIDGKPYTEFRMSPELKEKVNSTLKMYEGTHNFHNFTSKIRPFDPSAQRFIMRAEISSIHVSHGIEFATILIKGQSFMLHQIRKMMTLVISIVRNLIPSDYIHNAYQPDRMDISIAPGLGLVLNHVHYDNYNYRYGSDGIHEVLVWPECDEQVNKFHKDFILRHIEEIEIQEKSMLIWLGHLAHHSFAITEFVLPSLKKSSKTEFEEKFEETPITD